MLPLDQVLPRAHELAENLTAKPQLLSRYLVVAVRQRFSRRMAEPLSSAWLEGLYAADSPASSPDSGRTMAHYRG